MSCFLKKIFSKWLVIWSLLSLLAVPNSYAQNQETSVLDDSLNDMYIVLGTGTGGAILGLSTLSFVKEPGDHLKNIIVGGAIGIILGVGIVAYSQASKSKEIYFQDPGKPNGMLKKDFDSIARLNWHQEVTPKIEIRAASPLYFAHSWAF